LSSSVTAGLKPRWLPPKPDRIEHVDSTKFDRDCLTIKFVEGSYVRLRGGKLVSLSGYDLTQFNEIIRTYRTKSISRLFSRPENLLDQERIRGQRRSGKKLADLNLYYRIILDSTEAPEQVIESLLKLEIIEDAHANPIPKPQDDIDPETPDFTEEQGYLYEAPGGINAPAAWEIEGGMGESVKIIDIDIGFLFEHEDQKEPFFLQPEDADHSGHGVAATGVVISGNNEYGTTGICPDAEIGGYVVSVWFEGWPNIARAINEAADALDEGDILFLVVGAGAQGAEQLPIEYYQENFDAIETAVANGIIVVECASNGNENLDREFFEGRFDPENRHSGAILVGAGTPPSGNFGPDRSRCDFSNYGRRVDLQAWGREVTTTGGNMNRFYPDGDLRQAYTSSFSGTSSATPIVSGAVACIQGIYKASTNGAMVLSGAEILEILKETGTPQNEEGRQGNIGPRPNLAEAIRLIPSYSSQLYGTVTDAETDEPLVDAVVTTDYGFQSESDNMGNWQIDDALADVEFSITCFKQGYNDSTYFEMLIAEDDTIEINFDLLHPEFTPSDEDLDAELSVPDQIDLPFEVTNTGNGPLTWRAEERLRGDANAQPWELRRQYHIGQTLDDSRLQSVAFINDRFYVAGSNNRDPKIYVLNREGAQINQFPQFGVEGGYGYKDLAFDGELIYGSGTISIYAFTPEGELVSEIEGPFNPNNNFAYDTDREHLWVSSTTSDIIGIDRDGNAIAELDRLRLRIYGLAYWSDDPDGYPLYIYHQDREIADQIVTKMNPDNNDTIFVAALQPEGGGTPSAAYVSNQFDVYSSVFMTVSNRGADDRIDIWQIDSRRDWFEINPTNGTINAEESEDFFLNLNSTGLPEDMRFEAEIRFYHNAIGEEFNLPIALDVLSRIRSMELDLVEGWNMISINVTPEDLDIRDIASPIVETGQLILMKNGLGQFYLPEQNFCNIDHWNVADGYQVKVTEGLHWNITGDPVDSETPIPLRQGWNISAYFPRQPIPAPVAFAGIADIMEISKDGFGNFYSPEFGFSNMGNLIEGQGYQLKMTRSSELVYQQDEELAAVGINVPNPEYFTTVKPTDADMSVLLLCGTAMSGNEIAAYTSGSRLVGSGRINSDGRCGLAIWGDDPTTEAIDGAIHGETFTLKLYRSPGSRTRGMLAGNFGKLRDFPGFKNPGYLTGSNTAEDLIIEKFHKGDELKFEKDSFIVLDAATSQIVHEFYLTKNYPNPFNSTTTLTYGIPETANVSINIYDISGRFVESLVNGRIKPGHHKVTWSAHEAPTGVYIVRCVAGGKKESMKVALIR